MAEAQFQLPCVLLRQFRYSKRPSGTEVTEFLEKLRNNNDDEANIMLRTSNNNGVCIKMNPWWREDDSNVSIMNIGGNHVENWNDLDTLNLTLGKDTMLILKFGPNFSFLTDMKFFSIFAEIKMTSISLTFVCKLSS